MNRMVLAALDRQEVRYIVAGGWNTVFGYGCFAVLYYLLGGRTPDSFIIVLSSIIAISGAFLVYKLFVFRTHGNWLREYLRSYLVYGGGTLINLVMFPLLKGWLGMNPYAAQAVILVVTVVSSYIAHNRFTFARRQQKS